MAYSDEVLADSPAAYYRMDEASGLIADSSGNGNDATSTGGAGSATYGQDGALASEPASKAILFNPEFTFNVPDAATLDLGDVFSLECWFKFDTAGLASRRILTKQSGAYELRVNADNTFSLHRSDVSDTVFSTSAIPNDAAFHHLVATKSGATVKLYLDKVDVTGTVSNSTYVDNASALQIGGYVGGTHIDASLDEIALYPTALSAARVAAHYDAAVAVEQTYILPPLRVI